MISACRIIPARAGPTSRPKVSCAVSSDHPRSCGANQVNIRPFEPAAGSSPLVRGQQTWVVSDDGEARIIPARAGPTCAGRRTRRDNPDHPRSCGANAVQRPYGNGKPGSSPLVRGQHVPGLRFVDEERIIPARAGPTCAGRRTRRYNPDHPRSCGANLCRAANSEIQSGSSPLVRGQRDRHRILVVPVRIIPARAGPTRAPSR